jgi:hypothetical protein
MSGTVSKASKAAALARVQAIIAGTQKHFPNGSFTIGNAAFTTASLVQLFQSLADAIAAVNSAQASAKDAVASLRAVRAKVAPVLLEFKRLLLVTFGSATQSLADFGLEPPKARKPLTSGANASAAAKRAATRKARGTASKKQKLAVKGDVTGVVVTPVTSHPAASPASGSAQPAPATPSAPTPGASK